MNKKETYEIIIAEKLEQLPVPALEDAIWNRISAQLDIEMPETPAQDPPTPPNNVFLNSITLFVLLTALATWLFIHNYHTTAPLPATPPPTEIKDSIYQQEPPPIVTPPAFTPPPVNTPTPKTVTATPDTIQAMPLAPTVLPVTRDSLPADPPALIVPPAVPPPSADTPVKKRPAGVRGMKDEDYKIAPK